MFFAKRGEFDDGHRFAPMAAEQGAALLVVEHVLDLAVPQIVVADTVDALGALATEVVARVRAAGDLRIVGVTGSNGKTTTKNLLRAVLERVGPTVAARASFNNEVGAPVTMLELAADTRFLVAEMGASAVGEIARLVRMARPDVGIVLKVGLAHAGEFGGIEQTVRAKSEMVTDLLDTDVAVLNADDPRVVPMAGLTAARVVWFGLGPDADVRAVDISAHARGTDFTVQLATGESAPVRFGVLGEHHVMNALAAIAASTQLGVPLPAIVEALETVTLAERWRMQLMGGRDGITIINDAYNASPDSMAAALKTLAQVQAPGHAHHRRARRDERARRVLGGGARPDRAARRAARHLAARRRGPGRTPPAHHRHQRGLVGRRVRLRRDRRRGVRPRRGLGAPRGHDPREIIELGGSPPPRRPTGRMVRVRALLTAGALSLAFTLFLTPLFIRLFTRLGWGQFIRDDGPKSHHVKRGTPTMGGIIFILGSLFGYFTSTLLVSDEPTDRLGAARAGHDGRPRRRRLRRRLPEDPQEAEPRPRRLGEGRRAGRGRHGVRAARPAVPERRERDARPTRASRSSATCRWTSWCSARSSASSST